MHKGELIDLDGAVSPVAIKTIKCEYRQSCAYFCGSYTAKYIMTLDILHSYTALHDNGQEQTTFNCSYLFIKFS